MRSYDVHQHLWPESLVAALSRRKRPPRLRGRTLELDGEPESEFDPRRHELDARLAELDRDGVDVAVVSCPPTLGLPQELVDAYHEGIAELVDEAKGRLIALASDAVLDGFAGTSVAAAALLDLDRLAPIADELERRRRLLFVHPGPTRTPPGSPSWWAGVVGYTAQMQEAYFAWIAGGAQRWPDLQVLFAVLAGGAPFQLERLASRGIDLRSALVPSVYLDTASYGRRALELCLSTYGVGALVYGSDSPVIDGRSTLQALRSFGDAVTEVVCRTNPSRLLG